MVRSRTDEYEDDYYEDDYEDDNEYEDDYADRRYRRSRTSRRRPSPRNARRRQPKQGGSSKLLFVVIGFIALLVIGAAAYFLLLDRKPDGPPAQTTQKGAVDEATRAGSSVSPVAGSVERRNYVVVDASGKGDFTTVTEAMKGLKAGYYIKVMPGTYEESLKITGKLKIVGEGKRFDIVLTSDECVLESSSGSIELKNITVRRKEKPGKAEDEEKNGEEDAKELAEFERLEKEAGELEDLKPCEPAAVVGFDKCVFRDCDFRSGSVTGVSVSGEGVHALFINCSFNRTGGTGLFVSAGAKATLERCKVVKNATNGVFVTGKATCNLSECEVRENEKNGVYILGGRCFLKKGRVSENGRLGIAIVLESNFNAEGVEIKDNSLAGILCWSSSKLKAADCAFLGNKSVAVYTRKDCRVELNKCTIADSGGSGVESHDGSQTNISDCELHNLRCCVYSGTDSDVSISKCKISNAVKTCVSVCNGGRCTLIGCEISRSSSLNLFAEKNGSFEVKGCKISESGAVGVFISYGSKLVMSDSDIFNAEGPCVSLFKQCKGIIKNCRIYNSRDEAGLFLDMSDCVVEDSEMYENKMNGIAIYSGGHLTVKNCKIHNNGKNGGHFCRSADVEMENCEFIDNAADGIALVEEVTAVVRKCKFSSKEYAHISALEGSSVEAIECVFKGAAHSIAAELAKSITARKCESSEQYVYPYIIKHTDKVLIEDCVIEGSLCKCGIYLESCKVIVKGCSVTGCPEAGIGLHNSEGVVENYKAIDCYSGIDIVKSKNISILKADCRHCNNAGIQLNEAESIKIANSAFSESEKLGAALIYAKSVSFENCVFESNGGIGLWMKFSTDISVKGGKSARNAFSGVSACDKSTLTLRNMEISENMSYGILLGRNSRVKAYGCTIRDNAEGDYHCYEGQNCKITIE